VAPPQLWAYRNPANRLRRLQNSLHGASLQVLFPFEKEMYAPWAQRLTAGHFFSIPSENPARRDRLLLCPGSRRNVLRRNLPLWLRRVQSASANLDVLVPATLSDEAQRICRGFSVAVVIDPEVAYARAARAIAFPGTMTLDLFLRRIPTLVWAIVDPLTLWSGRRALSNTHVSLPNLLLEKSALPEWVGTPRDFIRNPPSIDGKGTTWAPILDSDWASILEKLGPSSGVEQGVKACLGRP
jgi:lipid A disaccharide synthetase